mgnify:FL=1
MALFVFHNSIYDKKSNTEQECLMTSNDKKAPITFIQKQEGIKPTPVLVVPEYYGKQNSTHRFQFWFDRDNPSFQLYPKQKYALKSFPKRDFHFIPYIKEIKRSVQLIMKIKDSYDNNISLDNKDIFIKSYNTIQVDKDYAFRYGNNHLHIICKVNPILIEISDEVKSAINENKNRLFGYIENTQQNMVTVNQEIVKDSEIINVNSIDNNRKNSEILKEFMEQEIDLPIQLIEVLMLGISAKARSANVVQIDPRAGTPYTINPYLERYELAIKKAIDSHFTNQQAIKHRDVSVKGFI